MIQVPPGDWAIEQLSLPSVEPLTLDQAKSHLRMTPDENDFDDVVTDLISIARNYIETTYGLPIMQQRLRLRLKQFPRASVIRLPIWPVQTVDAMTYIDAAAGMNVMLVGDDETQPIPDVITLLSRKPCELHLPWGHIWPPTVLQTAGAIRIDITGGFLTGASPELLPIPTTVLQAMKLLIGHYYENPEAATVIGRPSEPLVLGVDALMQNVRLYA